MALSGSVFNYEIPAFIVCEEGCTHAHLNHLIGLPTAALLLAQLFSCGAGGAHEVSGLVRAPPPVHGAR
jgi:hypothetical protein